MSLIACGINHKTAPITLREKVVFASEAMPQPLIQLLEEAQLSEAAILSTCHRTEFYCADTSVETILDWLQKHKKLTRQELEPSLYVYKNEEAVRHLLRVASGLDSMVVGEPQILGQLKAAFSWADSVGLLGKRLKHLSRYIFAASKRIRTETALGSHSISVASTSLHLAKHIFADIKQIKVLLVGAGEMIDLAIKHLQSAGVTQFLIVNRTLSHAEKLAKVCGGRAYGLENLSECLPQADMIFTATSSTLPLIGKGMVESAIKMRKHRPMLMIDFSVPRNIESEISQLDDVYLYSLDDLQTLIQHNLETRMASAEQAEILVNAHAKNYMSHLKIVEAVPIVRAYRDKAEQLRDESLDKAMALLKNGACPEEVLKTFARTLTNKLTHIPCVQLKTAACTEQKEILQLAAWLLGLDTL